MGMIACVRHRDIDEQYLACVLACLGVARRLRIMRVPLRESLQRDRLESLCGELDAAGVVEVRFRREALLALLVGPGAPFILADAEPFTPGQSIGFVSLPEGDVDNPFCDVSAVSAGFDGRRVALVSDGQLARLAGGELEGEPDERAGGRPDAGGADQGPCDSAACCAHKALLLRVLLHPT